ncbi:hypothetical protein L3X38_001112 [Prunus dulcis]|uniref:Uncharacterized protein n=1 Tax=Prunus dulcis TaxID=3755 RepID=A0AAD4WRF3_PRUDU|nr:hypothetical protein L3X38_001112 [Prunus dulcis]
MRVRVRIGVRMRLRGFWQDRWLLPPHHGFVVPLNTVPLNALQMVVSVSSIGRNNRSSHVIERGVWKDIWATPTLQFGPYAISMKNLRNTLSFCVLGPKLSGLAPH